MKKLTALTLTLAMIVSLSACGTDTGESARTSSSAETIRTQSAESTETTSKPDKTVETSAEETTAAETEPEITIDSDYVLGKAKKNITTATSYEVTVKVKGIVPRTFGIDERAAGEDCMVDATYTYMVTPNATYLKSSFENLNKAGSKLEYEEYQVLDDNIVTTITRNGDSWVDNTPKEMTRKTMMEKSFASLGVLNILTQPDKQLFNLMSHNGTRDNFVTTYDGKYAITFIPTDSSKIVEEDIAQHGYCGLFRLPQIKDCLSTFEFFRNESEHVYTFTDDYMLESIVFDIYHHNYDPKNGVNEYTMPDLHCEVEFSKWNSVSSINVPTV